MEKTSENIYDYIELDKIRQLLIHEPELGALFEVLCIHINHLLTHRPKDLIPYKSNKLSETI
jgi:hypothetical protein